VCRLWATTGIDSAAGRILQCVPCAERTNPVSGAVRYVAMIGRLDLLIIDCPDPAVLATFSSQVLGTEVYETGDDWAEISSWMGHGSTRFALP